MSRKTLEQRQRSQKFYGEYLPGFILTAFIFGIFYMIAVAVVR